METDTKGARTIEEKSSEWSDVERAVLAGTIRGLAGDKLPPKEEQEEIDDKVIRKKFDALSRKERRDPQRKRLFGKFLKDDATVVEARGKKLERNRYRKLRQRGTLS